MSEIREKLASVIDGVLKGELPLDTAEQVHLTAHRHVMDRYADDLEARRVGDKAVQKATEMLKKL